MIERTMTPKMIAPRFCEHGVQTFLLCHDCQAERCVCGPDDPGECDRCERRRGQSDFQTMVEAHERDATAEDIPQ